MTSADPASRGGCHCGRVAFTVRGRPASVLLCNCSMCAMTGFVHWIVPRDDFELTSPWHDLALYTFNTGVAKHYFCPVCGVKSFYIPRSDPDKIDVNVRCLAGVDLATLEHVGFDGQNWERHFDTVYRPRDG